MFLKIFGNGFYKILFNPKRTYGMNLPKLKHNDAMTIDQ